MSRPRDWKVLELAMISLVLAGMLAGSAQARRAKADEDKPPPAPGVTVERSEGFRQARVVLPGRLISYALPSDAGGMRTLHALVAPALPAKAAEEGEDGGEKPKVEVRIGSTESVAPRVKREPKPRMLVRIETEGDGALIILADDLPPKASSIDSMDIDGDGVEEILVAQPGKLSVVEPSAGGGGGIHLRTLVEDRLLAPGRMDPALIRSSALAGSAHLAVPLLGGMRLYGPGEDGVWSLVSEVELTLDARIDGGTLKLASPLVRAIGRGRRGEPLFATGPRKAAGRRLQTVLIDPLAEGDDARSLTIWSRLPEPENILESFFTFMDGEPVVMVTTRSAEKLSFFAEKRVRIFPLKPEGRARTGSPPMVAFQSGANLWQDLRPSIQDVNGDGLDDLVLAYWKGLKDDTIVLDAYLRRPGGKRPKGPGRTRFDLDGADRSVLGYGQDLDGDGLPELMLNRGGETLIYPGTVPGKKGQGLVAKSPRWVLPQESVSWQSPGVSARSVGQEEIFSQFLQTMGPSRLADLDGDGTREILALRSSRRGHGRIWVTWLGN